MQRKVNITALIFGRKSSLLIFGHVKLGHVPDFIFQDAHEDLLCNIPDFKRAKVKRQ